MGIKIKVEALMVLLLLLTIDLAAQPCCSSPSVALLTGYTEQINDLNIFTEINIYDKSSDKEGKTYELKDEVYYQSNIVAYKRYWNDYSFGVRVPVNALINRKYNVDYGIGDPVFSIGYLFDVFESDKWFPYLTLGYIMPLGVDGKEARYNPNQTHGRGDHRGLIDLTMSYQFNVSWYLSNSIGLDYSFEKTEKIFKVSQQLLYVQNLWNSYSVNYKWSLDRKSSDFSEEALRVSLEYGHHWGLPHWSTFINGIWDVPVLNRTKNQSYLGYGLGWSLNYSW